MNEIWVEVENTSGRWSVSNYGNVRANWSDIPQRNLLHRKKIEKTKILRTWIHTTGYQRVSLGRHQLKYVHRLVAQAFVPNPQNLPQVDHIDGNRQNNRADNLRWVTAKQNAAFGAERHNWQAQKVASAKRRIHEAKSNEYQALYDQGLSLRQIAKLFGTSHAAISQHVKR